MLASSQNPTGLHPDSSEPRIIWVCFSRRSSSKVEMAVAFLYNLHAREDWLGISVAPAGKYQVGSTFMLVLSLSFDINELHCFVLCLTQMSDKDSSGHV